MTCLNISSIFQIFWKITHSTRIEKLSAYERVNNFSQAFLSTRFTRYQNLLIFMNAFSLFYCLKINLCGLFNPKAILIAEGQNFSNGCPGYDTKQSDSEASVMLELWGMWSTSSLTSLPGPLWTRVVALDRVLSMGQIELNCMLILNWIVWKLTVNKWLMFNWIVNDI